MADKKINILIVDDEPTNLHAVANLLQADYEIAVATSASRALEIIALNKPHLILLDIHMPDMDGFELLEHIYSNQENKDIPVIFFSADDSIDFMEKGFDLNAVDYITKPIQPKPFLLKIALWAKLVRKTLENEQKQQLLDQYKDTVDRSTIVSKTDKYGKITYVNEKFCELSGYMKEELIGKPHNIVRHPDMPAEVFKELWQTIQSGRPWFGIVKNRKKNGDPYYVDTVINPIVDTKGNIVEYIGVRHDITELERYKEILKDELSSTSRSLEENLNYTVQYENAINSVTAVLKTDPKNRITYVNDKFCELMGYELEDIIGQNCSELRDKKHRDSKDCDHIMEQLKNKKIVTKLLSNVAKDNARLHFITLFYPIVDLNGEIVEHLQVMHDVTDIIKLSEEIESTQKEVVLTMGAIGESRSKETGLHVKRVAEYSYALAKLAGLNEEKAQLIRQASPMHDIGKVGIPDSILHKNGKLSTEEFEVIKTHSELGYDMLKHSQRRILKTAATIARTHHEKFDGSGYPRGLQGEDIPIEGRITAIADVFDALGHDRCYKKAWELEAILELFENQKAKHFDPRLIDLFVHNLDMFLSIRDAMKDNI